MLVYMHFVAFIGGRLKSFVKLFQTEAPLVHVLYEKVNEVKRLLMHLFMKAEVVGNKEGCELKAVSCEQSDSWLPLNDMNIGIGTRKALTKISSDDRKKEIHSPGNQKVFEDDCYVSERSCTYR